MEGIAQGGLAQWLVERERWAEAEKRCAEWTPPAEAAPQTVATTDELERARLVRTIEAEIIPRLMLAHRPSRVVTDLPVPRRMTLGEANVLEFTRLALADDTRGMAAYVDVVHGTGVSLEVLCSELFTPTARRLGEMWESDECDFVQVTLGLWALQQVLREKSSAFASELAKDEQGLCALLVPAPGEEHTLGLSMVVEFFRRAGWEVAGAPPATAEELRDIVGGSWFDVVGLSVSNDLRLPAVAENIRAVRDASMNRNVVVLVGGALFVVRPDLAAQLGADMAVQSGVEGPIAAERLLAQRQDNRRMG
jgi:methanogenic corrinoid protein MtbC1